MLSPRSQAVLVLALSSVTALAGCEEEGTCEYRFEEGSPDGSIPQGLEACAPHWQAKACDKNTMSAAAVGLKTSGYTFTASATCEARGYKECGAGRGIYYKVCAEDMPKTPGAKPAAAPRPNAPKKPEPTSIPAPIPVPADAPFRGAAEGNIVLQVFSDYEDPFTARYWATLNDTLGAHPDLKVVFRHNPLPFHKNAPLAHQAAVEAFVQKGNDGFWALHDLISKDHKKLDRATLVSYATDTKLDVAAFEKALDGATHAARVEGDLKVATDLGLQSSPMSIIGTRVARGQLPKDKLSAFIKGP